MKRTLSILLILVMMLTLIPAAFAADQYGIAVYVDEIQNWPINSDFKTTDDNILSDKEDVLTDPTGAHWKYTIDAKKLEILSADVAKVVISSSAADGNTIVMKDNPTNPFVVVTEATGLTVVPGNVDKGLIIKKGEDYPVKIAFDKAAEVKGGLAIIPFLPSDTFTLPDIIMSDGYNVTFSMAAAIGDCQYLKGAAVNTTGSLIFTSPSNKAVTYTVNTSLPEQLSGVDVCGVNVGNSSTAASSTMTVDKNITLNSTLAYGSSSINTAGFGVLAYQLTVNEGASVDAKVTGAGDTTGVSAISVDKLISSGSVKGTVASGGLIGSSIESEIVQFIKGEIEATGSANYDATDFDVLYLTEGTQAVAGDSKSAATVLTNPEDAASYDGKAYARIYIPVPGVTLSPSTKGIALGQTFELTAITVPDTTTVSDSGWTVSNDNVSFASKTGKTCVVKADKVGESVITVTDDAGHTATCEVTVTEAPATSVSLNKNAVTIPLDGSFTLIATTDPESATVSAEGWTADNDNVTLTKDGKSCTVTGDKVGTSVVKVKDSNGNEASCTVTVTGATGIVIYDPSAQQYSLGSVGEHARFQARVTPAWTAENNNDIRWTSSNDKIAKVIATEPHGTGAYIQATGVGSTIITASCGGQSAAVTVYVVSDYKFTAPTGKLIWYYDRNPQYNLEFSTSIPYQGIQRVVIQAGNRDYDFTGAAMQNTYGTVTIPYSTLYGTFGRQTTTMTVKVYYGPGANDYIYKNLYYRSIYDAPLTADTDMTWAYVTMLVSGLFISASPLILKRSVLKRRGISGEQ